MNSDDIETRFCSSCDGEFAEDEMIELAEGAWICEGCYDDSDDLYTCDICGKTYNYELHTNEANESVCDDCSDEGIPDYEFNGNSDYWRED